MPDRDVQTIRDLIYYQYAKLVARSAFSEANGKAVKAKHYGFVKNTFRDLKSGRKLWSDIAREDWQLVEAEETCSYCSVHGDLHREHIVPRSLSIKADCPNCHRIQDIHNQVWACQECNSRKATHGLYEFFQLLHPAEKKFFDFVPPLVEKKYLKTIFHCHECAETLDGGDLDGDHDITVLDIDYILHGGGRR